MHYTTEFFDVMRERSLAAIYTNEERMIEIAGFIDKDLGRTLISTKEFPLGSSNSLRLRDLLYAVAVSFCKIKVVCTSRHWIYTRNEHVCRNITIKL